MGAHAPIPFLRVSTMATCGLYTVDDLDTLPVRDIDGLRLELFDGWPVVSPSPSYAHQRICLRLAIQFEAYGIASGVAVAVSPGAITIPPNNEYLPDVLVIPGRPMAADWRSISNWLVAVEVLSPSNRDRDLSVKRSNYLKWGVPEVWLVDPFEPTVRIARRGLERDVVLAPPESLTWRGLTIDLTALFADD